MLICKLSVWILKKAFQISPLSIRLCCSSMVYYWSTHRFICDRPILLYIANKIDHNQVIPASSLKVLGFKKVNWISIFGWFTIGILTEQRQWYLAQLLLPLSRYWNILRSRAMKKFRIYVRYPFYTAKSSPWSVIVQLSHKRLTQILEELPRVYRLSSWREIAKKSPCLTVPTFYLYL